MKDVVEQIIQKGQVQGLITVQLFDAESGELQHEEKTHNFISQGVLKHVFNSYISDIFTRYRHSDGVTTNYLASERYADLFRYIILTNDASPEDPMNEWLRKANATAFARTDNSDSNTTNMKEGNINRNESRTIFGQAKLVFDWSTEKGNGTFQSINFEPISGAVNGSPYREKPVPELVGIVKVVEHQDKLYMFKPSADKQIEIRDATTLALIASYNKPVNNFRDFTIKGDRFYFVKDAADVLWSMPLSDLTATPVKEKTWTLQNAGGIDYDPVKNEFYIGEYSTPKQLFVLDGTTFADKKVYPMENSSSGSYSSGYLFKIPEGFIVSGRFWNHEEDFNYPILTSGAVGAIRQDKIYTQNGYIVDKMYIGSRVKLAAPITKNNNQVMKVTYEFITPTD
ncbi:hypothetical protein [Lysinibacillus sp. NPDC096212]|uniref:hypothetical protein n=1 Tax=Lysinibacillus sp. NPDC096212 TaxID=3364135 RepID=UPI00380FD5C0